jgi:hypothetical protein
LRISELPSFDSQPAQGQSTRGRQYQGCFYNVSRHVTLCAKRVRFYRLARAPRLVGNGRCWNHVVVRFRTPCHNCGRPKNSSRSKVILIHMVVGAVRFCGSSVCCRSRENFVIACLPSSASSRFSSNCINKDPAGRQIPSSHFLL